MKRFRHAALTVFNPLTLLILFIMMVPAAYGRLESAAAIQSTPESDPSSSPMARPAVRGVPLDETGFFDGTTMYQGDEVERYVWGEDAVEIAGTGLTPLSLTVGNYDPEGSSFGTSVFVFAEFKNTSDDVLLVPIMRFEALYEGRGFGEESAHSPQYFVRPGESVYYQGFGLYRGAVLYGDWTDMNITFLDGYDSGDEYSTLDLRLEHEEGKVYNDGTTDVGSVVGLNIDGIGRDAQGIFVATCYAGNINATIPAGLFVRLPENVSLKPGPGRYCHDAGRSFVDRLGSGPMSVDEWIITVPKP